MSVTGRILWGESPKTGNDSTKLAQTDYLQIKNDGDYFIMPMEDGPITWHEHWADAITPEGIKRRPVRCSMRDCFLCAEYEAAAKAGNVDKKILDGMKAKQKWGILAYLLAEGNEELNGKQKGRPVVFEFGKQIYDGISQADKSLRKVGSQLKGTVILVNKEKARGVKAMYIVNNIPVVKTLNDEQKAAFEAFKAKGVDLEKMYETPTNEMNMRRLGRSVGGVAATTTTSTATAQTGAPATNFNSGDDAW